MVSTAATGIHYTICFISMLCNIFFLDFKMNVFLFSLNLSLLIFLLPIIKSLMNYISKMRIPRLLISFSFIESVNRRSSEDFGFYLLFFFVNRNLPILPMRNVIELVSAQLMKEFVFFIIFSFHWWHKISVSSSLYSLKLIRNLFLRCRNFSFKTEFRHRLKCLLPIPFFNIFQSHGKISLLIPFIITFRIFRSLS